MPVLILNELWEFEDPVFDLSSSSYSTRGEFDESNEKDESNEPDD